MTTYCDKEHTFYGKSRAAGTEVLNSLQASPRSQSVTGAKTEDNYKSGRKHDKVRTQKDEFEKITRIERELSNSIELR